MTRWPDDICERTRIIVMPPAPTALVPFGLTLANQISFALDADGG